MECMFSFENVPETGMVSNASEFFLEIPLTHGIMTMP
jgi:hypothetical protein